MKMLLALALVLLPLAGCLGPEEAPAAQGDPNLAPDAASPASAAPVERADAAAPAANASTTVPIAWDGFVGRSLCIPAGTDFCLGAVPMDSDAVLLFDGVVSVALTATLSWEAESPLTETLAFRTLAITSCGENCYASRELHSVEGAAPLALDLANIQLEEGESLALAVDAPFACHHAAVVYGCAFPAEQAFRVEGELVAAG